MTYHYLLIRLEEHKLQIILNREAKRNALNRAMFAEIRDAITEGLHNPEVRGMIVMGAGEKAFAAGADIQELAELDEVNGQALAKEGQEVFNLIHHAEKPIIAAINGYALGGGLELAMACHIRIASHVAKLGLPEVALGLIPGYGGTQRLTQLVGRGNALEMILTGHLIHAEKAFQMGLVNYVVPADEVLDKAKEVLTSMVGRSPVAIAAAIRSVNAALKPGDEGFDIETEAFSKCLGSAEVKEGINAFLEKRREISAQKQAED